MFPDSKNTVTASFTRLSDGTYSIKTTDTLTEGDWLYWKPGNLIFFITSSYKKNFFGFTTKKKRLVAICDTVTLVENFDGLELQTL